MPHAVYADYRMVLELIKNVTLLITLCWLHGMLMRGLEARPLLGKLAAGVLFGDTLAVDSDNRLAWRQGWLNYYQVPLAQRIPSCVTFVAPPALRITKV